MTSAPPHVPKLGQTCYLVTCRDAPRSADLRKEHLDGHLQHVEENWERYVTAGPLRDPGGEALVGSAFLVLGDSLEDVEALMKGDPYMTCGMYETIEYKEFTNSIGLFIGGKIWESSDAIRHRAAGGPPGDPTQGLSRAR